MSESHKWKIKEKERSFYYVPQHPFNILLECWYVNYKTWFSFTLTTASLEKYVILVYCKMMDVWSISFVAKSL
ncbi:hypothetical protein XELAEV_18029028mg [Xenopus laevis]|uniref:Uncharacterized protein n=1 Tax=Xenopus laevis TaxID=8355 RepID=A0A974CSM0_XENLA|nr:hypothetical protein XELAEV_18029028mg [Xenopus laevis]